MNLTTQTTMAISIIIILIVFLIILYICSCILNKKNEKQEDCNCALPENKIIEQLDVPKVTQDEIQKKDKICLYYTDWCGYSIKFLPEWKKLKSKILSSELKNKLETEEFECDKKKEKCQEENVRGFPSIILHKINGERKQYEGERDADAIIKFCLSESN
jgi:hypothetical protein